MSLRTLAIAAIVAAPTASAASTLDVFLQGSAGAGELGTTQEFTYAPGPIETLADARTEVAQATSAFDDAEAVAAYDFDGRTGEITVDLQARTSNALPGAERPAFASSAANIDLTENFFVSGTGTVTIGLSIDATWNAPEWLLQNSVSFFETSGLTGGGVQTNSGFYATSPNGTSGSLFDEILELSFAVDAPSGGMIEFTWFLGGVVSSVVPGVGDFLTGDFGLDYSATIFVRTDGGVTATPQTAGFLAGPGSGGTDPDPGPEVNVIPLPASALLLLAGLGGLGALRRSKRLAG
jgi:hypothetical protein